MFPPLFGSTADLSKASSLVLRIGTDAHLYDDPEDVSIAPLLESKFDPDRVEALKRLLALMSQGADVSNFFPQVVKNVASQSLEVKKLVYLYLLHYAQKRPDEALLSINCFQKDLSDPNPLVRAWALRTMAGIRLHAIAPLVSVAVSKCARDPSAYVRKCAASALPKLSDLRQDENNSTIKELVSLLLGDNSPVVVGAAAYAFNSVCPHELSLIGRNFRRLCEILPDVEEWGQIMLIGILLRYAVAKHGLVKESVVFASSHTQTSRNENLLVDEQLTSDMDSSLSYVVASDHQAGASLFKSYIDGPEKYLLENQNSEKDFERLPDAVYTSSQNSDIKLLLQCTSPLLWSQNSAVVLAATTVHWIMAPRENLHRVVKPILFVLRSSPSSRYVVLCNIQIFAKAMPLLFAPYYEDFFISSSDSYPIRTLKLEILSLVAVDTSIAHIFEEIQDYIRDPDRRFAADAVAAIGLCAQRIPAVANSCVEGLMALIKEGSSIRDCSSAEGEAGILVQAIMSIKTIIKQNPVPYEKVIVQLAHALDVIKEPSARALIVWIVGEYSSIGSTVNRVMPIIVKYLAKRFTSEDIETKQQILNTVAKVVLHAAPGYEPLPKPCSLPDGNLTVTLDSTREKNNESNASDTGSTGLDDSDSVSEFSAGDLGSVDSAISDTMEDSNDCTSHSHQYQLESTNNPLTHLSDLTSGDTRMANGVKMNDSSQLSCDLVGLMSKTALESWLDEQPDLSASTSYTATSKPLASMRISVKEIAVSFRSTVHNLLQPINGNGLRVDYTFSREVSTISPSLVCMELFFENTTSEPLTNIIIEESESVQAVNQTCQTCESHGSSEVPDLIPFEEIALLSPEQKVTKLLQIHFHHHLLPSKVSLRCNEKTYLVKLQPDIGYFVKPLPIDVSTFVDKESQLPGMFEYNRRCTFKDHLDSLTCDHNSHLNDDNVLVICRELASKILSGANVFFVSVDMPVSVKFGDISGLCLRFSGEILSSLKPCLLTVTADGSCSEPLTLSVKINCEDSIFGLNLLNRVVSFLS